MSLKLLEHEIETGAASTYTTTKTLKILDLVSTRIFSYVAVFYPVAGITGESSLVYRVTVLGAVSDLDAQKRQVCQENVH